MAGELTPDRIRILYQQFREQDPWPEWEQGYRRTLASFQALSEEALGAPAAQEALWRAEDVASLGPGEAVPIEGAYTDPEIVEALVALRTRRWAQDPGKRARQIQEAYDAILEGVHPRHAPQRPQAKLARAFAALLPADLTPCFHWKSFRQVSALLLGNRKVEQVEGAVLARARLRGVLGPEEDLAEHVRRATFCWWLHEHYDTLVAGESPVVLPPAEGEPEPEVEKLSIWAPAKQRMGVTSVAGYVATYRAMVTAARGGATADDVVQTFRLHGHDLALTSCRQVFSEVRWLEFVENIDGLWHPSEDGEQLLEEDPPHLLVERMLQRVFGMAWALRYLGEAALTTKALAEKLRVLYPAWKSDVQARSLVGWLNGMGLVERFSGYGYRITPYGRAWLARLPAELPVPVLIRVTDDPDEDEPEAVGAPWPTLQQILDAFRTDPELRGFVFDDAQICALHLAWHAHERKRFVILSGLSGTGKTALLTHYARIYSGLVGRPVEEHRAIVPVSPDWRDPTGLLGYLNALHADPTFQAEPALRLVLAAARNPGLPYFLLLDEMNLARVERYFAPFLSAMETGDRLILHPHDEPVNDVPPSIPWPANLFIGGTVNMDETTHPFSDKVLDRAFTLEFFDVQLERFLEARARRTGWRDPEVEAVLVGLNQVLRPIRRHFGYRTAGEVLDFVQAAAEAGVLDAAAATSLLDQAIFSKVLPRLRGEQSPDLERALDAIEKLCAAHGLVRCREKVQVMTERLHSVGVTRFWS